MWKPDRTSRVPLYRQIADHLERRIAYGELPSGTPLPSERVLARQLDVNRSTVIQAYEELRASGLIESVRGSGTRVSAYNPVPAPNWRQYAEGGALLPNLPLIRRIRGKKLQGGSTVDFASGELSPDLVPVDAFRQIMNERPFQDHWGYGDPQGYAPLREALVSYLRDYHGIQATPSSILITSGSQQCLYLITQCLLRPGDTVAVEEPSYYHSLPMFQSAGLRIVRLPVDEKGVQPEEMVRLHRKHRIRMIFLNPNFQNPTGTVLDAARRTYLLEAAAGLGIPIVEDDPFSLTAFQGSPPLPLKSMDTQGTLLYVGSLSKIAASGLRIGWLIAPEAVVTRLADALQQLDFGLSVLPQWLAEQYLRSAHFPAHLARLRRELAERRVLLTEALERHLPGEVTYSVPSGGLHLWCKLRNAVSESKLMDESLNQGVMAIPGSVFGSAPGYFRFTFARPAKEEIDTGIARFAKALRIVNG